MPKSSPPWRGLTRRLRRGERACSPMGRSIVSVGDPKGTGGNEGKRVPSGHNRRRRLATRSSGKQQAERTAVRAAPIVCPEESPQCARRRTFLPPAGPDAPTPAREKGLQPYGALDCFRRRSEGGAGGRAESHPACSIRQQLCRKKFPWRGLTRRLRCGSRACSPMGRSIASRSDPKGTGGRTESPQCARRRTPPAPGGD